MTHQCNFVLKQIKKLTNSSDMSIRFNASGFIYPFNADEPFADCSKYKSEFSTILQELQAKEYIYATPNGACRLTHKGIHPVQFSFDATKSFIIKSVCVPIVVSFLTALLTLWIKAL